MRHVGMDLRPPHGGFSGLPVVVAGKGLAAVVVTYTDAAPWVTERERSVQVGEREKSGTEMGKIGKPNTY